MTLLEAGASIEGKDDEGRTVLRLAAEYGNEMLLDLLIKNNANVNDRDNKRQSALQYALESHNVDASMTLLEAGASTEGKDQQGRTVLHLAAKCGYENLLDLLIKNNANVTTGITKVNLHYITRWLRDTCLLP